MRGIIKIKFLNFGFINSMNLSALSIFIIQSLTFGHLGIVTRVQFSTNGTETTLFQRSEPITVSIMRVKDWSGVERWTQSGSRLSLIRFLHDSPRLDVVVQTASLFLTLFSSISLFLPSSLLLSS